MQKLSKDGGVQPFDYQFCLADTQAETLNSGAWLLPVTRYATVCASGAQGPFGLVIEPSDDIDHLAEHLASASLVAINFPAFADGRGFSIARRVKETLNYSGDVIAVGEFMQDQLHYLMRCGFDGFIVDDNADIESMALSLNDFSDGYQASADRPTPLFRRRS